MKSCIFLYCLVLSFTGFSQNFDIYVSDAGNFNLPPWQILKYDSNGQNPSVFINTHLNWPQDILFLEDSNQVLISNFGSGSISKHDATTGAFLGLFASGISGPTRMKIGPDGLLYVLQWEGTGKVKRYNINGTFVDDFTSKGVPQSIGLDWDSDKNLFVSSYYGDIVRNFDSTGTLIGTFINTNLVGPTNLWFDANGDLLVSDYDGDAIKRFDSSGAYLGNFITGLDKCEGVAVLPNGNILVGNGGTHSVKMFSSNGSYIQDLISNGSGNLITPNAVVVRTNPSASIQEPHSLQPALIYPTIGTTFYVSDEYLSKIANIKIYNAAGTLVFSQDKVQNPCWLAANNADGLYTITAQFVDGTFYSDVLMVQK